MIAFCGIDCAKCDAFIATATDDHALRAATAEKWAKLFSVPLAASDIQCTGCRSTGVKLGYCEHMCEIRRCAAGRGLETCAACGDYVCTHLEAVLSNVPEARAALEELRDGQER